jgi:hypothetical protein
MRVDICMGCNKIGYGLGKVTPVQSMRVYGGVGVERHTFMNYALDIGKWIYSCSSRFFSVVQQPPVGHSLLIIKASRSHSDTPQSVGLLWTSDQPDTNLPDDTQHSQETDVHEPGGTQTHNTRNRAAADPGLRPRGHLDRLWPLYPRERKESVAFRTVLDALWQNYSCYYKRESNQ